ncbi:hypothetical protein [Erythrobacter sp.]|uniref:hypothetical protein n=1 Tax=Erythrobacter sp. TaxID=1042 RepID=UPI003C793BF7
MNEAGLRRQRFPGELGCQSPVRSDQFLQQRAQYGVERGALLKSFAQLTFHRGGIEVAENGTVLRKNARKHIDAFAIGTSWPRSITRQLEQLRGQVFEHSSQSRYDRIADERLARTLEPMRNRGRDAAQLAIGAHKFFANGGFHCDLSGPIHHHVAHYVGLSASG